jgi:Mor family transcriptional regulator
VTKKEREALAKIIHDEYYDNTDGQISLESLAYKYKCSPSTIHRRINQHKAKLAEDKE